MMDLRPIVQEALASRWRLEPELGCGGMGVVFLAAQLRHSYPPTGVSW